MRTTELLFICRQALLKLNSSVHVEIPIVVKTCLRWSTGEGIRRSQDSLEKANTGIVAASLVHPSSARVASHVPAVGDFLLHASHFGHQVLHKTFDYRLACWLRALIVYILCCVGILGPALDMHME